MSSIPGIKRALNPPETHEFLKELSPLKRLANVGEIEELLLYLERTLFLNCEIVHLDGGACREVVTHDKLCRSLNVEILGRDPVKIAFLQNLIRRLLFSLKEEEKMIAITGITGRIGRRLAGHLLAQGQAARGVVRDPKRAENWKRQRCEVAVAQR